MKNTKGSSIEYRSNIAKRKKQGLQEQQELCRGKKRTEIHKMPARRQGRQKHRRRDGGEQGDSHRWARHSEKAIRGKISDRTDETH